LTNSPNITTPNIVGVTNGSSATAGSVGEYGNNTAFGVALTSGSMTNAASITIAPGDYDIFGAVTTSPGGGATITSFAMGLSTTSLTFGNFYTNFLNTVAGQSPAAAPPMLRVSSASSITVYLVVLPQFSGGTCTCNADIEVRRRR
jgi:hypothetical protein